METIRSIYEGNLRTNAIHVQSGEKIITDAPKDNQGKGEAFSPTDLLAASLASCMMTIMGIRARKNNINVDGISAKITKIMAQNPRRVCEVIIEFEMPEKVYSAEQKTILEDAALNCPVAKSIHPDLKQTIIFNYR